MKAKLVWAAGGGVIAFFLFLLLTGGPYTITPPSGPVDAAYKMNRLTGKVWLIKTYTKQVGPLRVLAAREAEVEETKPLNEADIPSVAAQDSRHTISDRSR